MKIINHRKFTVSLRGRRYVLCYNCKEAILVKVLFRGGVYGFTPVPHEMSRLHENNYLINFGYKRFHNIKNIPNLKICENSFGQLFFKNTSNHLILNLIYPTGHYCSNFQCFFSVYMFGNFCSTLKVVKTLS